MLKVMIVDDEQLILKGMKTIIQKKSGQYVVAGTALGGEEALRIAEKCRPDLVITDICMPDVNGLELIEKLKSVLPEAKFVVLSGYGEFSYAQEALRLGVTDYLLKPVNGKKIYELLEKITAEFEASKIQEVRENERKQREDLYQLLYLKKKSAAEAIRNCLEPGNYYTVVIITYQEDMRDEVKQRAALIVEEYFQKKYKGIFTTEDGETAVVVQAKTVSEIHLINRILKEAAAPCNIRIFFSDSSPDLNTIEQLFWQAKQCQEMAFYRNEGEEIVQWKGECIRPLTIDLIDNEEIQIIGKGLKEGQGSDVKQRYRLLLEEYEKMMIRPCDVVRFIHGTFRLILNQLTAEGIMSPVIDEELDEKISRINLCRRKEALVCEISDILDIITKICRENTNNSTSKIIQEAKKYIQNHYQEDITLTALASQVFISPKYLSDLFKKETGDNYTSYLVSVRMEHAKRLLGQLNYKIYEIAEMVGYQNPKHFIKAFKKEVGMTPGEYRNRGTF